ncbi:MAG: prenyltransferase/squalene oxidase repeat-containing protein [Candidatus Latescibacterota bacterium]
MRATQIREHALAGSRWLVAHQNTDGSWIGLPDPKMDAFYKGAWALTLTGELPTAHRVLDYAKQHFLTSDGDFLPREHPWHHEIHYPYANAYFVVGSMITGRYEISVPAIRFLLGQQNPVSGGFHSVRTDAGRSSRCDSMSTGAAGMACLAAGELAAARGAADFLGQLVALQPTPADRFFCAIEANGRLGTDAKEADEAWWRIVDTHTENQCWYAVGLPFAFLVQMAQATGEMRYRELAEWFFDFQLCCVDPWDGGSSGKGGWGAAMCYRITGENRYRDIALRVADQIVALQNPDGGWAANVSGGDVSMLTNPDLDTSAEFTLWLALISSQILARDGK